MAKKLLTTPKGVAVFPHLHAPDTKFDKAGVWSTKLALEGADAQTLKATVDNAIAEVVKRLKDDPKNKGKKIKQADAPYSVELDDSEQETGRITFNFKLKHKNKRTDGTEYEQQPSLYDAALKPVKLGIRVGGGSIIRVSYELNQFPQPGKPAPGIGCGVSLRLRGVQLIELKEFGGDASYFGFEAEEGGFASEPVAPVAAAGFTDEKAEGEDATEETDF